MNLEKIKLPALPELQGQLPFGCIFRCNHDYIVRLCSLRYNANYNQKRGANRVV